MKTTIGQLLVNDALPEDMRDYKRVFDKKGLFSFLEDLARRHPEQYREVTHKLNQIGWRASQETGGYSFGLKHMRKSKAGRAVRERMDEKLAEVLADDSLSDEEREKLIVQQAGREMETQKSEIYAEAREAKNPLAMQVMSGSRGNPMNLASLLGSDVLYTDHHDRVIPVPVTRSYSEGLTPAQYWAGTYGARKGVMATKFATQEAGFLSKQLNQMTHRLVVTDEDHDGEPDIARGLPVDVDDPDSEGSLLSSPVGGYKRNTVLTPKILHNLQRQGVKRLLVRSPTVGGSPEGGIYARDAGVREKGDLPGRGENIGLAAAQAMSEPLSQSQLSAKHSGGVAGEEKGLSGFAYINQLIQVPKTFKGGAVHAQEDGPVTRVEDAPAGGQYVYVGGNKHFVGAGYGLKIKRGDTVEAGDVLSEGIPNPAEVVKHKGVGEGRRYFTQAFRQAMSEAGLQSSRRNAELLSRGLINHVRLTEEYDQFVPDDVIPYATLEHRWKPRQGTRRLPVKEATGKYLEKPVLHYSVGTRIKKSMLPDFEEFGVAEVDAHDDEPPFQPEMIRGMYSVQHDPDWMTRLYGSGQKKSLLTAVHRGGTSDELGTSFVPSIATGVQFGRQGLTKQPELGKAAELEKEAAGGLFGPAMQSKGDLFDGSGGIRNQYGGRNELAGQIGSASYGGSGYGTGVRPGGGGGSSNFGDYRQIVSRMSEAGGGGGGPGGGFGAGGGGGGGSPGSPGAPPGGGQYSRPTGGPSSFVGQLGLAASTLGGWRGLTAGVRGAGRMLGGKSRASLYGASRGAYDTARQIFTPFMDKSTHQVARETAETAAQAAAKATARAAGTTPWYGKPGQWAGDAGQWAARQGQSIAKAAPWAGKLGRGLASGARGAFKAIAPIEFAVRSAYEVPMMFGTDPTTGKNEFRQHAEGTMREAGNWKNTMWNMGGFNPASWVYDPKEGFGFGGTRSYLGRALETGFSPSTLYNIARAPFNIAGTTMDKANIESESAQAAQRINQQRGQEDVDQTLQGWGATPEVAAKYKRQYIDESDWYDTSWNPFSTSEGRMGFVDRATGQPVRPERTAAPSRCIKALRALWRRPSRPRTKGIRSPRRGIRTRPRSSTPATNRCSSAGATRGAACTARRTLPSRWTLRHALRSRLPRRRSKCRISGSSRPSRATTRGRS
jgi:hypothetical protein